MDRRVFITRVLIGLGSVAVGGFNPSYGNERTYLTKEQALKLIFPKTERIFTETYTLTETQLIGVQQALHSQVNNHNCVFYRGETNGITDGYAMIIDEIGKEQFITFVVGISSDFKVKRVALMVFRESRGWEVSDVRFTNQFGGKSSKDRLLIGSDIIGVTGATLSSRAFCRGTKKALILCETFYRKK